MAAGRSANRAHHFEKLVTFHQARDSPGLGAIAVVEDDQGQAGLLVRFEEGPLCVGGLVRAQVDPHGHEASRFGDDSRVAQDAALEGKDGGLMQTVSTKTGEQGPELKLESLPVWDGMAIARGQLFVAGKDGSVRCFGRGR